MNTMFSNECTFSIELTSRRSLNSITFGKDIEGVLIDGNIGAIQAVYLHEEMILEITGTRGTLRLDIGREELEAALKTVEGDE
jgi:hypothetical protein